MKICPKCFAEYDEKDIKEAYPCCIECYGDCADINLLDKEVLLERLSVEDLRTKKAGLNKSTFSEKTQQIISRRIDKLIKEKQV